MCVPTLCASQPRDEIKLTAFCLCWRSHVADTQVVHISASHVGSVVNAPAPAHLGQGAPPGGRRRPPIERVRPSVTVWQAHRTRTPSGTSSGRQPRTHVCGHRRVKHPTERCLKPSLFPGRGLEGSGLVQAMHLLLCVFSHLSSAHNVSNEVHCLTHPPTHPP